jgi:hypothetical protein
MVRVGWVVLVVAATLIAAPIAAADYADERALAERHAPIVRTVAQAEECGHGEPFTPTDIDLLLDEPTVALRGPWNRDDLVKIAPSAKDLVDRYVYHLDSPEIRSTPAATTSAGRSGSRPGRSRLSTRTSPPSPRVRGRSRSSTGSSTPSTTSTTPTRATGR